MGAFGVVVGGEFVELSLKVGDGFGGWLGVDPAFECLVEAFDFALSLWVSWPTVFLLDAVVGEDFLKSVAAAFSSG